MGLPVSKLAISMSTVCMRTYHAFFVFRFRCVALCSRVKLTGLDSLLFGSLLMLYVQASRVIYVYT